MPPTPSSRSRTRGIALLAVVATLAALVGLSAPAQAAVAMETLSGTVTSSDGTRLSGIRISIDNWDTAGSQAVVVTGADGSYSVSVPRVEHDVFFEDTQQPRRVRPDSRNLPAGTATARTLNMTLAAIARPTATEVVSGVATSTTGTPLRGLRVTVDSFTDDDYRDDLGQAQTSTGAGGAYTVTVPRSVHTVCFNDPAVPARWRRTCQTVRPAVTSPRRLDIVVSRIGSISGTVRDTDGSMASEGRVRAYRLTRDDRGGSTWSVVRTVGLRAAGDYTIGGLDDGTYRVCLSTETSTSPVNAGCAGGPWVGEAQDVVLAGGQQSADIRLGRGTLHWSVTPETAGAFDDGELSVHVYRRQGDAHGHLAWQRVVSLDDQLDDDSLDLPAGTYRVELGTPGAVAAFYPGAGTTVVDGSDVVVTAGATTPVVARLAAGGAITGTMSGATSYAGSVRAVNLATGEQRVVKDVSAGGTYSLTGLRAGSYRVEFNRTSGYSPYVGQYYRYRPESAGEATADPVVVTDGATRTGINTTLVAAGTITGTLVNSDGSALSASSDASVVAIGTGGPGGTETSRGTRDPVTGYFSIPGVSAGTYRIVVETGEGLSYYAGTASLGLDASSAVPVTTAGSGSRSIGTVRLPGTASTLRSVTAPTISGAPQSGELLSADPGTWSAPGASFAYQWLADGTAIDGATGRTYRATGADLGRRMAVVVTASLAGYREGRAVADDTPDVVLGVPVVASTTSPVITGTPRAGSVLSVSSGSWSPAPSGLSYAWLREGRVIAGADADSYTLGDADVGRRISVRVTASKASYAEGVVVTAATAPVTSLSISSFVAPVVSGAARWGSALSVSSGAWSTPPSALGYQWLRDGVAIPGATGSSYTPGDADTGRRLAARVTASKASYVDGVATSASTVVIAAPVLTTASAPTISGILRYGSTLRANVAAWSPSGVVLSYQWYAGTTPIARATGSTYTVGAAVVGRSLRVRVTASRPGSVSVSATSAATRVVASAALRMTRSPSIRWYGRPGAVLAVAAGAVSPAPTVRYQWLRNGVGISGATRTTYRVTRSDRGRYVSLRMTYAKAGYAGLTRVTNRVAVR